MPNTLHTTQPFILLGSLLLLVALFSGCHQHTKKFPQGRPTSKAQSIIVEQQLLATIKNAENLEQGNPLLLSSLYSLANFYYEQNLYEKAASQYERALHIKEQISGPNHPDVAVILKQYARVLQKAKRPTQAANLLARADALSLVVSPAGMRLRTAGLPRSP